MSDLIDRAAAIDAIKAASKEIQHWLWEAEGCEGYCAMVADVETCLDDLPSVQPYTEAEIQKMQDLEQAELDKAYECGRASAQPEIVRCKDCKHYEGGWYCSAWNNSPGFPIVTEKGYCNLAERRTDEQ